MLLKQPLTCPSALPNTLSYSKGSVLYDILYDRLWISSCWNYLWAELDSAAFRRNV